MLISARKLIFLTIVGGGILVGMLVKEHAHKVAASTIFGVCIGLVWRFNWVNAKRVSPQATRQVQHNVEEAQQSLRGMFGWRLGPDGLPPYRAMFSTGVEEVLSDVIAIVLSLSLAAMVYVLPVYWENQQDGFIALLTTAGAHLFALCCTGVATFGLTTRLTGKSPDAT